MCNVCPFPPSLRPSCNTPRGDIASRGDAKCDRSSGSGELDREAECRGSLFFPLFPFFPSLSPSPLATSAPVVASPRIANYYVSIYARPRARRVTSEARSRGIRRRVIRPIYPPSAIFSSPLSRNNYRGGRFIRRREYVYRKHVGLD